MISKPRYNIRQGDQYPLRFQLRDQEGNIIGPQQVSDVSITLGTFNKRYAE